MSENWAFQLSLKIENHLLNVRADTIEDFVSALARLEEHKEPISLVIASYSPQKPQPSAPAVTPGPRPIARPTSTSAEIGPIQIEGVEIKKSGKDGVPFKSPLYLIRYDGISASTFDSLLGKAALGFWSQGHPCYLTVEPSQKNPRFQNLTSIRMAAQ